MTFSGPPPAPKRPAPPHLVPLSKIAPERITWLSPGRLAAGKITLLDGDPGLGKSTLLCEFAARLSRGDPLPGGDPAPPRKVLLLSAEDDLHDTIRPRLDAAGGDPALVIAFPSLPGREAHGALLLIPDHLALLEEVIARTAAALVVLDPLFAFLSPRLNASSDQAVRRALAALRAVAERTGTAIVAVRHLNKSPGGNPLYRGGGSIGVIGAARCGLLLAADPDDPGRRILAATKSNLAQPSPALAFRLAPVPHSDVARIVWEGESDWTAADLLRPTTDGPSGLSALAAARAWLRECLAAGPRPAHELLREAHAAGIGRSTLYAAKHAEGIRVHKERVAAGRWIWSASPPTGEDPAPGDPPDLQHLQHLRPPDTPDAIEETSSPIAI